MPDALNQGVCWELGLWGTAGTTLGREGSFRNQPTGGRRPGPGFPGCPADIVFSGTQLTLPCAPFLRWLLNLFHNQIESKFRKILESKVRMSELP